MENLVLVKALNQDRVQFSYLPRTFDLSVIHTQDVTEEGNDYAIISVNFLADEEIVVSEYIEIPDVFVGKYNIDDLKLKAIEVAGEIVLSHLYDNKAIDDDGDTSTIEAIYLEDFQSEVEEELYQYLKDNCCIVDSDTTKATTTGKKQPKSVEQSSQVKKRSDRG